MQSNNEKLVEKAIEAPAVALQRGVEGGQKIIKSIPMTDERPISRVKNYWYLLGPGLTTGASDDDPSGIATYSQTGAQFGFGLLWLAAFTFPLMAVVQEMCARIGLVTGRGLASNIRVHFGTTITPYLFFWQTSQEIEEEIAIGQVTIKQRAGSSKVQMKKMRIDVWSGMFFSNIVMFFIIAACGSVLFAHGITNISTASEAAQALRPLAGSATYFLFSVGIIGMGFLAIPVMAGSSAYAISESFDALEEMEAEELKTILKETTPTEIAKYLSNMEPDEAAEALRDVDPNLRGNILLHMTSSSMEQVEEVLSYDESTAGGIMTTKLQTAKLNQTAGDILKQLSKPDIELESPESIVVVNDRGKFVYDLSLIDIVRSKKGTKLSKLIKVPVPVTATPDSSVRKVAQLLVDSRSTSIVVLNASNRPIGRILADDVVDSLLPRSGGFHFPRLWS
ncbi:unnamed protein product [Sphagnum balticum]